jgi:hypothetical protein
MCMTNEITGCGRIDELYNGKVYIILRRSAEARSLERSCYHKEQGHRMAAGTDVSRLQTVLGNNREHALLPLLIMGAS